MPAHGPAPRHGAPLGVVDIPALVVRAERCAAPAASGADGGHVRRASLGGTGAVPDVGGTATPARAALAGTVLRDECQDLRPGPTRPSGRVVLLARGIPAGRRGSRPDHL